VFTREITTPMLCCDAAREMFPQIFENSFFDRSFGATLRAILPKRMEPSDVVRVIGTTRSDREAALRGATDNNILETYARYAEDNTICITGINGSSAANEIVFRAIDEHFLEKYSGYEDVKDVVAFISQKANTRIFINKEKKSSVVFCEALDIPRWHYIQAFIARIIPWYFDGKSMPYSEEEKALAKSLTKRTATEYETLIEQFAEQYDFRSMTIKNLLAKFERESKRVILDQTERSLREIESQIARIEDQYRSYITRRSDEMIKRDGIKYQMETATSDNELIDYFTANKKLNVVSANGSEIEVIVTTYLENYDCEAFNLVINKRDSVLLRNYNVGEPRFSDVEVRKKFLREIFNDDPDIKIKFCAYYRLDLRGEVSAYSGYSFPAYCRNMMPNPHLDYHSCIGNHKMSINASLRNGDVIGAVEQCVSSAGSVNVLEEVTIRPFLSKLFDRGVGKVIELPDGTSVTPSEALDWITARDAQKNGEETVVKKEEERTQEEE